MQGAWSWVVHQFWKVRRTPGVVYSEDYTPSEEHVPAWQGAVANMLPESVPAHMLKNMSASVAGPEESPYTSWERWGLTPMHASRLRPRQFYMPTTDFSEYEYDDASPEENELRSRWMARLYTFNTAVPGAILCVAGCFCLPLHTIFRLPLLIMAGTSGVMFEASRVYLNALQERQDLDDFTVAKEFWYIKNREVAELGLPTIPRGQESYYQTRLDPHTGQPIIRVEGDFEAEQRRKRLW